MKAVTLWVNEEYPKRNQALLGINAFYWSVSLFVAFSLLIEAHHSSQWRKYKWHCKWRSLEEDKLLYQTQWKAGQTAPSSCTTLVQYGWVQAANANLIVDPETFERAN